MGRLSTRAPPSVAVGQTLDWVEAEEHVDQCNHEWIEYREFGRSGGNLKVSHSFKLI